MNPLEEWTAAVCADLGLDPAAADITTVLDLARDVAHGVARPAAPLTAYLVGVAVGLGLTLPEAAGRISALAADWRVPGAPGDSPRPLPGGGNHPGCRMSGFGVSIFHFRPEDVTDSLQAGRTSPTSYRSIIAQWPRAGLA